jgi:MoxR-like ATPase
VLKKSDLRALQRATDEIFVDHAVVEYAVRLVLATRDPEAFELDDLAPMVEFGASPRASLGLVAGARALALLRGRNYVLPDDVSEIAPDVLRHRIVLSFEAAAEGADVEDVVTRVVESIAPPRIAPSQDWNPSRVGVSPNASGELGG